MFRRLSLQFKLVLAFLFIASVLAGASFYLIRSVQQFNGVFMNLMDNDVTRLNILSDMQLRNAQLHDLVLEAGRDTSTGQPSNSEAQRTQLSQLDRQLRNDQDRYQGLALADGQSLGENELRQLSDGLSAMVAKSTAALKTVTAKTSTRTELATTNAELDAAYSKVQGQLAQASGKEQRVITREDGKVDAAVVHLQTAIVVLALVSTAVALGLGILIASWISRSLSRIRRGADHIANGDFSHPIAVRSDDQIGQLADAFNRMSERLKDAYRRQAIAQQRDEAIILSMGEGLIAVDSDNRVSLINRTACDLLELPDEASAVGKPGPSLFALYGSNDASGKPLALEDRPTYKALHTGNPVKDEYELHRKDGAKHVLTISANPVKLNGQVIGAVTVLRDITKEKEVDRMKTEFISLASHQLRTPLSAIKWFSEMLVSGDAGELKEDQMEFAKNIADSTERMIDLVNALLNISRIESGRIVVDPKPTDVKELVNGIVSDLKAKIEEKQHSLVISVHEDLPKINLDPRLIGQVYMNLLTNAIKYTPKGGEISVFVSRKDDQIISQITDNGYGIPEEQQGRLFQKFFRAANAVKVETDGTGLGLYLIKAIIESSGGKIWFKSAEGKGSTFWFSMPMSGMKARAGEVTLDV
jgi:signal transduction histidine kinase